MRIFENRREAGRALAHRLAGQEPFDLVVGMARGGVLVAAEVARALGRPLAVLVVRKIGAPGNPELALGALSAHEVLIDPSAPIRYGLDDEAIAELVRKERRILVERADRYRKSVHGDLVGRRILLVDDGLATGLTARVAIRECLAAGAREVVFAAPVGPPETAAAIEAREGARVVLAESPRNLHAVGHWYRDFTQTTDAEVLAALEGQSDAPR